MDADRLIRLLESAAQSQSLATLKPEEESLEIARNQALLRQHPEVEAMLRSSPEVLALEAQRMGVGGHTWRVDLAELAGWLLRETMKGRGSAAVAALLPFATSRSTAWNEFVLLSGLTCSEELEVVPGLEVIPFSHVPTSWSSRQLETALADRDPNWHISPNAAVLRRHGSGMVIASLEDPDSKIWIDDQVFVALALTVGLGHAVMERGIWMRFAETTPLGHHSSWITQVGHEVYVGHRYMAEREVTDASIRLAATFLASPPDFKRRLVVPLQRYRLALLRRSAVDAAIELGVAFEASVIEGRTKKDLTTTGAAGVSLVLGGDRANRETQYSIYEQFYDSLRSPAVHTGLVDETKTVKVKHRGNVTGAELVQLAKEQCRAVLEVFIKAKAFPDWETTFPTSKDIAMTAERPHFQR